MVLGGCGNVADGARADQFNGGSSTGQRQQHGGRPLDWEGDGTANRSGSGNHDASAGGSQSSGKDLETQVEKETQASVGNLETCRSGRLVRKKVKEVNSLYS
ncbi:uncharacterized protein [Aegilops tauschii subsp. strangulata]|uniref:uncharacterized protein n=1 Tax=Aegilops tauschii subsp. strangulata TaxID=200361 RepID=UPI001ABC5461|nr:uncharacterized protein LOC109777213 [Aegilops tauschii subsp. strangulata]